MSLRRTKKSSTNPASQNDHASVQTTEYTLEFGGTLGALGIVVGLPFVCLALAGFCNDTSGCPGLFSVQEIFSIRATVGLFAYFGLLLLLYVVLPGQDCDGAVLPSGKRLSYRLNSFSSLVTILGIGVAYTFILPRQTDQQSPDWTILTWIWDNYVPLLSASIVTSAALSLVLCLKPIGNDEWAEGGRTPYAIYNFFVGRELNPRIILPSLGDNAVTRLFYYRHIDLKVFCELRPGMIGWIILNVAFIRHQFETFGYVTDSILLVSAFQTFYVVDALWNEAAVLTTMDVTTDGLGYMLVFGDLVWVPFTYSLQARYLAMYPLHLGWLAVCGILAVQAVGYYIFRSSNNEKNRFRTNPKDPRVSHLECMETKSGSKLLVSGWWGTARHINYFGDWVMAWAWCLPTGLAGFRMLPSSQAIKQGATDAITPLSGASGGLVPVTAGVSGWAIPITYFYVIYFAVLLIHREMRDEHKCQLKYGKDWDAYKARVKWRIIPGVY